jgi:NAD(P)-dependent dehydrogenase (short-subunit alcohol dehydrogenase family)
MMNQRRPITNRFAGKVAIVTGGANGIGRSIVEELCREGCAVTIADISEVGAEVAKGMNAQGYQVLFRQGNLVEDRYCQSVVDQTVERFGQVNYLVNNAFSFTAKGLDASREDWERSFMAGPVAYAMMAKYIVEPLKLQGGGAIVNMSSISAFIAQPNRWTYNACKGAVNTLTKCMAFDLAPFNIRVNSVSPGWIWTQEVFKAANLDGGGREKWDPIWGEFHMLRRCGEPVEVAAATLFLLSEDADFITAADLPVDGGYMGMGSEGLGKATRLAGSQ